MLQRPKKEHKSPAYSLVSSGFVYTVVSYATNKFLAVNAAPLQDVADWNPGSFGLDLSGVAALLGGDEAVAATIAAFTTGYTWWIIPYTPPGAYVVANTSKYLVYGLQSGTSRLRPRSNLPDCLVVEDLQTKYKEKLKKLQRPASVDPAVENHSRDPPGGTGFGRTNIEMSAVGNGTTALQNSVSDSPTEAVTTQSQSKIMNWLHNRFNKANREEKSCNHNALDKIYQITKEERRGRKKRESDNLMYIFQVVSDEWTKNGVCQEKGVKTCNGKCNRQPKNIKVDANGKHVWAGLLAFCLNVGILIFLGYVNDWYACGIIGGSRLCNFCFLGSVALCKISVIQHQTKDDVLPPGHVILSLETGNGFVAVFGNEDQVNNITKTRLKVEPRNSFFKVMMGVFCILMQILVLAQLLVTPQVTYAGKLSFLVALLIGWIANAYYSSLDSARAQRNLVREHSGAKLITVLRGTRTANLIALAFLTGMKSASIDRIYPDLLAGSDEWEITMKTIGRTSDEFKVSIQTEATPFHYQWIFLRF